MLNWHRAGDGEASVWARILASATEWQTTYMCVYFSVWGQIGMYSEMLRVKFYLWKWYISLNRWKGITCLWEYLQKSSESIVKKVYLSTKNYYFTFCNMWGDIWLPNGFALCPEKCNEVDIQISIAEIWLDFSIVNAVHVNSEHMAPISDLWGGDGM